MDPYRVLLAVKATDITSTTFDCMARDEQHARKLASDTYPDGKVRGAVKFPGNLMPNCWRRKLAVGSEVWWQDPDNGLCSGWYRVFAAKEGFPVCHDDDILMLRNAEGSEVEAYAHELEEHCLVDEEELELMAG